MTLLDDIITTLLTSRSRDPLLNEIRRSKRFVYLGTVIGVIFTFVAAFMPTAAPFPTQGVGQLLGPVYNLIASSAVLAVALLGLFGWALSLWGFWQLWRIYRRYDAK